MQQRTRSFLKIDKIDQPLRKLKEKRGDTNYQYHKWNVGYQHRLSKHQKDNKWILWTTLQT